MGTKLNEYTNKFISAGLNVFPFKEQEGMIIEKLEPLVYQVMFHPDMGYYLAIKSTRYDVPEKLYGDLERRADKIVAAYHRREVNTGAQFIGDKGGGKTGLMRVTCNKMLDAGIPVVELSQGFSGQAFNSFVNTLGPICMPIDEFAKLYDKNAKDDDVADPQSDLLTLFDGLSSGKRLFLISENKEFKINEFMRGRPGRFLYRWRYNKIDEDVAVGYSQDRGVRPEFLDELIIARDLADEFSFDALQEIVNEHLNSPEESFEAITADMNVDLAEKKYILQISGIKCKMFDEGLVETTRSVGTLIDDFNPDEEYENYNHRVDLTIPINILRKFENTGAALRALRGIRDSTRNLSTTDDSLDRMIQEIINSPIIRSEEEAGALAGQSTIVHTMFMSTHTNKLMDGDIAVYGDNFVKVKGTLIVKSAAKRAAEHTGF